MSPDTTLTPEQRAEFRTNGLLRLRALLPPDLVEAAQATIRRRLAAVGLWAGGTWALGALPRPQWPDNGLDTKSVIGNRHPELAAIVEARQVTDIVADLLDRRPFAPPGPNRRPQTLFTLPNAEVWTMPAGSHTDSPRLAGGESVGVQLFTFLETVEPRGGGTLVVAGSHRLVNEDRARRPADVNRLLRRYDYFAALFAKDGLKPLDPPHADGLPPPGTADDVPLEVVELTGRPGDVWLMDLRLLHTNAPNAGPRPRVMLTYRYQRSEALADIARAYGWPSEGSSQADETGPR